MSETGSERISSQDVNGPGGLSVYSLHQLSVTVVHFFPGAGTGTASLTATTGPPARTTTGQITTKTCTQ